MMEPFNTRLWEKYQVLKKRKASEMDERHAKQEANIRKYQLAMENLIETLRNDNNQLRDHILSKEDAYAECQKLLMEESKKTKELASEVERLHNLLTARKVNENGYNEIVALKSPYQSPKVNTIVSKSPDEKMIPTSPIRDGEIQNEEANVHGSSQKQFMPDCCRRNIVISGNSMEEHHFKCVFQTLMESVAGVKFCIDSQSDQLYLSVVHQSSGYTFSLTWSKSSDGDDGEWFYHATSLGALERVALDWMREDIMFSSTMCPLFFEKLSRVLGKTR